MSNTDGRCRHGRLICNECLLRISGNTIDIHYLEHGSSDALEALNRYTESVSLGDEPVWESKDWRKTPVSQMKTDHIRNALNKVRRSENGWRQEFIPIFEKELSKRASSKEDDWKDEQDTEYGA